MHHFLSQYYLVLKALHIIAIISWMAGMLYLPRLFVYHASVDAKSKEAKMLCVMEHRLLRYIINPAMIASFALGGFMIWAMGFSGFGKWLHAKLFLLFLMTAVHGMLAMHRKKLANGTNKKSHVYFRVLNEVPTVLMIFIVFLAVLKPF